MTNRLHSSDTLVRGMANVGFNAEDSQRAARKRELEAMIKAPQLHMGWNKFQSRPHICSFLASYEKQGHI